MNLPVNFPWRRSNRLVTRPMVPRRHPLWDYAMAVLLVAAVAALRLVMSRALADETPFLLQLVAVATAAAAGGFGPGITATIAAAIVAYLMGSGIGGGEVAPSGAELRRFILEGAMISILGGWLAAARRRAEVADTARAALEKQMLEIGDKERRRFGHDLHDGLGQQLTGIAFLSESLAHNLAAQKLAQSAEAERIASLVSDSIGWTRELARGLSPLTLEADGLAAALEELATSATKLFNVRCHFDSEHLSLPIDDASAVHVYRIVQEAVSNSVKHGKARNVQIRAEVGRGRMRVSVTDDGSGLSAKTMAQPGIGLRIMQYRANLIGAQLTVSRAAPQGGTIVSCALPVTESASNRSAEPDSGDGHAEGKHDDSK